MPLESASTTPDTMPLPVRQIVCMKWGTLYGPEYVNQLYAMARLNTSGALRFVCLTDDVGGIVPEVECLPCPTLDIPMPYALRPWRKVSLWGSEAQLPGMTGDWLFLDLDLMITGGLDAFFEYKPQLPFIVMQNWTQPGSQIGNTSAYRFRVGSATHLYLKVMTDFAAMHRQYTNSQTFISREIGDIHFWPDEWCLLFKVNCVPPWPQRYWQTPPLPTGARIVAFPGSPNPIDALHGKWPERKILKRLYKRIRPTPWIGEIWAKADAALGHARTRQN